MPDNINDYLEPVPDPIVSPEPEKEEIDKKMSTPAIALRRSYRANKGLNNRLKRDFELYTLCCH